MGVEIPSDGRAAFAPGFMVAAFVERLDKSGGAGGGSSLRDFPGALQ